MKKYFAIEEALKYAIDYVNKTESDVNSAFDDLISGGIHFYFDGICIQHWLKQENGEWTNDNNNNWNQPSQEEVNRLRCLILTSE